MYLKDRFQLHRYIDIHEFVKKLIRTKVIFISLLRSIELENHLKFLLQVFLFVKSIITELIYFNTINIPNEKN